MSVALAATDVAAVRRAPIEEGIAITGNLRPIETVDIRARLEGDLVGVYVREGETVRAGQLLARFEALEQESARRSAEAQRAAARSALATAQWNLDQTEELFKAGAIPERDLRAARQSVDAARAQLAAAESQLRAASSGAADTRVLAPTAGVIASRQVENGEHVARGAPLFTLVRTTTLELEASVPARDANDVRTGQVVRFAADGRQIEGRVVRVSPTIDPATRAVSVFVQVPNPDGSLKGGTFATGRIIERTIPGALVVPTAAIRQTQNRPEPFVYRIGGGVLEQAPVQIGVTDEAAGTAEVLGGLAEGDRVVVGNVGTLGAGMRVTVVGGEPREPRGTGNGELGTGRGGSPGGAGGNPAPQRPRP
jgi:RND family efflux transporter MFP subunit